MAVSPSYLADKSALARMTHADVAERLAPLILGGQVATCAVIDLEFSTAPARLATTSLSGAPFPRCR